MPRPSLQRMGLIRLVAAVAALAQILLLLAAPDDTPPATSPETTAHVWRAGVARADVTPDHPIRLTGYAARKQASEGVEQRLWAKALAFEAIPGQTHILITVDNCGVCSNVVEDVAARLKLSKGIARERLAVCSSHTHSGPATVGFAPNIFVRDYTPEELATIEAYTRQLADKLTDAAERAVATMAPARLEHGEGRVGFAANRRTKDGPTERSLPVLAVRSLDGKLIALVANYACHCTTLGHEINKTCGDWAGYAQEEIEARYPGATALITIGCGADSNPTPRGGADFGLGFAKAYGKQLADEVASILDAGATPLSAPPTAALERPRLPFQTHFTREQWLERAKQPGIVGFHANKYLKRLDKGETLPQELPYVAQAWTFGNQFAMVFLAGEVVVDYALRLKERFDPRRLWITAYANDVPCYIPSRRVLNEGGYEAEDSLWYYDRPARLAPEIEERILSTVSALLPAGFRSTGKALEFPPPLEPRESLKTMRAAHGLKVLLAAAEPLVQSPVAIDWGPDGRLWVAEMYDYPQGVDGNWKPGGRVKFLEDTNGDGVMDRATVFLDDLPFPTGVTAYGNGVFVCAAPDVLYAQDTDGDGKPDKITKILSGFATENFQARVNSISLGLDNWFYGANGLIGGVIHGLTAQGEVDIRGRDFRFRLDSGRFEPVSGLTQQGRARDDWGNWFGCDNSTLAWHYPIEDRYMAQNPNAAYPDPRQPVATGQDPGRLHPISRTLKRFNDPASANRVTSACGLAVYRDDILGSELRDDLFVCEPVHNLVRRVHIRPMDATFAGDRAPGEETTEFLASQDNWSRPVQVRTGPDGALWVVDMYRFVIEHPRWITADRLRELDVRAGAERGRIYRIVKPGAAIRPVVNFQGAETAALVRSLKSPNGTERDRAQLEILRRQPKDAVEDISRLASNDTNPRVRIQAYSCLQALGAVTSAVVAQALADPDPAVRRYGLSLAEALPLEATRNGDLKTKLESLAADPSLFVRMQLALTLGTLPDTQNTAVLVQLAKAAPQDPWMRTAVLCSAPTRAASLIDALADVDPGNHDIDAWLGQLGRTAARTENAQALGRLCARLLTATNAPEARRWSILAVVLENRPGTDIDTDILASSLGSSTTAPNRWVAPLVNRARSATAPIEIRTSAARVLAAIASKQTAALDGLKSLLTPSEAPEVQRIAAEGLGRLDSPDVAEFLAAAWRDYSPMLRAVVLAQLLNRKESSRVLLKHIADSSIRPGELPIADRQRLLKHTDAALRNEAAQVLGAPSTSPRAEVLAAMRDSLELKPNPMEGGRIFGQLCASCHRLRGQGVEVGPNLAALSDRSGAFLLQSILDPNAAVATQYVAYEVETADGRELTGLLTGETASALTLVASQGVRETLLRSQLRSVRASTLSLMPEGLETGLSKQALADLIGYVQSAPAAFGVPSPDQALTARKELARSSGRWTIQYTRASEHLDYPSWLGRLPMHYCRQTDGQGAVAIQATPTGPDPGPLRLPIGMGLRSQPAGGFALLLDGKEMLRFEVSLEDQTWTSPDGSVSVVYLVQQNNEEDSNGLLEIEVSKLKPTPGKALQVEVRGAAANSQRWFGIYEPPSL